jgi:4-hydroxy-tetrahydrodipicolinate synthase
MPSVTGSFVAIVTPFNTDGSVDYQAFQDLIAWHESHGTGAVLIMGSTGEVSMLSPEERREIVEKTAPMRRGKMQMWYGCTGGSTDHTIAYLRHAKASGADGAILAAPAYICAPEADIEAFMLECADSVDLPLGIYNNPPRVKTDLHWSHMLRLLSHPNFVVLKESTTRVGQVAQIIKAAPKHVAVMCCDSPNLGLVVPTMTLGGHGTANMTGNIDPVGMARLSTPFADPQQSVVFQETYLEILPLLHFTYSAINPVAVKSLLKAVGMPVGALRRPLSGLDEAAIKVGLNVVRELELDKRYGWKI